MYVSTHQRAVNRMQNRVETEKQVDTDRAMMSNRAALVCRHSKNPVASSATGNLVCANDYRYDAHVECTAQSALHRLLTIVRIYYYRLHCVCAHPFY